MSLRGTDENYSEQVKFSKSEPGDRKHHTSVEGGVMRSTHPKDSKKAWIKSDTFVEI